MNKIVIALLLAPFFAKAAAAEPITASRDTRIEETETLYYAPGENAPDESARDRLRAWAQRLAGKPGLRVEITGHADERLLTWRARTLFGDNLGISNTRAKEVANILRAQPGFADVPLSFAGKGDTEPKVQCKRNVSANKYKACLAPNRRVEIHGWYDAEAVTKVEVAPAPEPAMEPVSAPAAEPAPAVETNSGYYALLDFGKVAYSGTASQYDGGALPNPVLLRIGGGYRFHPHLAVEAGYSFIGKSSIKGNGAAIMSETLSNSSLQVAAVGIYPINDMFEAFGKLGLGYTRLDYSYADAGISGSGSGVKATPVYGLGVQYNINKHHSLRAQYENFGKTGLAANFSDGTSTTATIGIAVTSIGWMYKF